MRSLPILVGLLAIAGAAAAQTEEPDPFAEDVDLFGDDPFAALEENVSETEALQDTAEGAAAAATSAAAQEEEAAPSPTPAPAASPPAQAAPQEDAGGKGAPGFELVALLGALAVALLVMRRR